MDKIKVEICCGTACYLLGAANLMSIEDEIPAELRDKVEVEARTCLELCEKELGHRVSVSSRHVNL